MADLVVHEMGESITEAIIGKWLKSVGDYVEADEPVVDLETDKINVELAAPAAGVLAEQRYSEGETVKVGDVVGMIEEGERPEGEEKQEPKKADAKEDKPEKERGAEAKKEPDEKAEKEAETPKREQPGLEDPRPPERDGSGRVLTPSQRRAHREGRRAETTAARPPAATRADTDTDTDTERDTEREEVVPMSPLRKRIAERLVEAQQSSASLTTFNEVDLTEVIALRQRFKESFLETHGVKLGFMSFFVKAACEALKLFPGINAEVDGDSIVYKKYYDIGIAVGTDRGLVVPVLRGADALSFAEIESGITDLATRAKKRKLVLDDLMGATFTITNGGIYGSMMSTPLLNFPQSGILGMHNIVERPMVVDGSVAIRPMMYVALTYDHRVVDGKEAVQFLVALKERLEQPDRLMLGV